MTKLLDQALEAPRNLPPDAQDEIAHVVLRLASADDEPPVELSPEEQAAISTSKAAAARGEFATDEQVRAVWSRIWVSPSAFTARTPPPVPPSPVLLWEHSSEAWRIRRIGSSYRPALHRLAIRRLHR